MIYRRRYLVSLLLLTLPLSRLLAQPLSLEQYLKQVREKHEGIRATEAISEGAKLRSNEGGLLTFPSLFGAIQWADDKKPTANAAFSGTQTKFTGYTFGLQEQTNFGLSAKLSYTLNYTQITGSNPAFLPVPTFYEAKPMLELSQSLLRNGFGSETRATIQAVNSQARATALSEAFKLKMALAEAEMSYWGLAVSREMVTVQKDSLERAKKIKEWSAKRARLELADKTDLLQAEAGLQGRTLEYQIAIDEQGGMERAFNRLRGSNAPKVEESLDPLQKETLEKIAAPSKKGIRLDVQAAEAYKNLAEASGQLGKEKNLPGLDVYGTLALNGRSDTRGTATGDSFKTQFPTYGIGVKFSTPLDFGTILDDRAGYIREMQGAELNYRRKVFEEAEEWKDLSTRVEETRRRLKMTWAIEAAQSEKLLHERERLRRGRSVTFQVLQFEQDFASAQAIRIKTEAELLRILTQMKTFGD